VIPRPGFAIMRETMRHSPLATQIS
jgi:hypothetical protein